MKRKFISGQFVPPVGQMPSRLLIFSPHPDDLSISCGGLIAYATRNHIEVHVFQATLGGDARMPEDVLQKYGFQVTQPREKYLARENIRKIETLNELACLGLESTSLYIGIHQSWSDIKHTPISLLNEDLSISNIANFVPGPITLAATDEIAAFLNQNFIPNVWILIPSIPDRLIVHNMISFLVLSCLANKQQEIRQNGHLVMYQCLSSILPNHSNLEQHTLIFDQASMDRKIQAINCHWSMRRRREEYGGYENRQRDFYDVLVRQSNISSAEVLGCREDFGENYFF